jgi:hypothetical protein
MRGVRVVLLAWLMACEPFRGADVADRGDAGAPEAGAADANASDGGADAAPPANRRYVFVTASSTPGRLANVDGDNPYDKANQICNIEAKGSGLGRPESSYVALLCGDSQVSPLAGLDARAWYLPGGNTPALEVDAENNLQVRAALNRSASGSSVDGFAWTGCDVEGRYNQGAPTCDAWTSSSMSRAGLVWDTKFGFSPRNAPCNEFGRLICVQATP